MRNIFFALVAGIVVARGLYRGNFGIALGAAVLEIPVSILLGRAALWNRNRIGVKSALNRGHPLAGRSSRHRRFP